MIEITRVIFNLIVKENIISCVQSMWQYTRQSLPILRHGEFEWWTAAPSNNKLPRHTLNTPNTKQTNKAGQSDIHKQTWRQDIL